MRTLGKIFLALELSSVVLSLSTSAQNSTATIATSSAAYPSSSSKSSSSSSYSSSLTSTSTALPSSKPTPSPANISPQWTAAYAKAQAAVAKLNLNEKVDLATGVGWQNGYCVGNTPPIPTINFPGLCLEDSPLGVRFADYASAFPPAINVAATFNRTLMNGRGLAMGQEFVGKGVNVALGPMMNLMRAPAAGRNWEGFGGDPYLSGEGAYETIMGLQSAGVQATAKHYINNEQEHQRTTSSSDVDDRTEHELYALPFLRSVQANVAAVMCSYNEINGSYACENDATLNGILKGEFGFQGYVMSDWSATHSTLSVNSGLDMTMPGDIYFDSGTTYFGATLVAAVQNGSVPEWRIDDMATRILGAWYLVGQDANYPAVNFDAWNLNSSVNTHVNVQADHRNVIRAIGSASTVLLKNNNNVLPLKAPKTIALIGSAAGPGSLGPDGYADRGGNDGVLGMGWGSGTANYPYLVDPMSAITPLAAAQGTNVSSFLNDFDLAAATSTAFGKSVAVVFITSDSGEDYITVGGNEGDRNNITAWNDGDALVQAVAAVNNNTIVIVNSVGPIVMEIWIENPNVTAVVWSGVAGQEAGNGLADVLYGAYNPSGRLPFTIGKSIDDYSAQVIYADGSNTLDIPYSEGIFIDYKHFDAVGINPRYEFGYGMSYTTFEYADLGISGSPRGGHRQPQGPGSALDPWLHNPAVEVTFKITNNGSVAGHEIPQLYVTLPASANSAPMNLKGFDSIFLEPQQSAYVKMILTRFNLAVWDVTTQQWEVPSGEIGISVGASSRDIRLKGSVAN